MEAQREREAKIEQLKKVVETGVCSSQHLSSETELTFSILRDASPQEKLRTS